MSINDFGRKIKSWAASRQGRDVYIVTLIIVVGFGAFGLGRLSVSQNDSTSSVQLVYPRGESGTVSVVPASILSPKSSSVSTPSIKSDLSLQNSVDNSGKDIVASSRGSKYYYTWCSGAKNLSEANKIFFSTESEAEAAGYSKSTSCK
jgi:hypothetical protein